MFLREKWPVPSLQLFLWLSVAASSTHCFRCRNPGLWWCAFSVNRQVRHWAIPTSREHSARTHGFWSWAFWFDSWLCHWVRLHNQQALVSLFVKQSLLWVFPYSQSYARKGLELNQCRGTLHKRNKISTSNCQFYYSVFSLPFQTIKVGGVNFFLVVCVCYVSLYVLREWTCLWRPQEVVISVETVVRGSCRLPCRCWEPNQGPLQEQQHMLLTIESFVWLCYNSSSPWTSFMPWPLLYQALWEGWGAFQFLKRYRGYTLWVISFIGFT